MPYLLCQFDMIYIYWYDTCHSICMDKKIEVLENDKNQHVDDFYLKFKEKLEETHSFPSHYMFKYIVPSEQSIMARLYSIFNDPDMSISTRNSKNGKYISVTIKALVNDANDVIIYYRQTANIDGIVML